MTNKFKKFDIASRVLKHGDNKLEIKLEYNLEDLVKTNNYKIETYFFIPRELRITKNTYPKEDFYKDAKNHIRFMNPLYTLAQIIDPKFKQSPLYSLSALAQKYNPNKKEKEKKKEVEEIIKDLQLTGTMVRARLRDWRIFIKQLLEQDKVNNTKILADFSGRMENCQKVLKKFRHLQTTYNKTWNNKQITETFQIVEEFLSNLIEERLTQVFVLIEKKLEKDDKITEEKNKLTNFLTKEQKIRKTKNFKLILTNTEKGKEKYLYWFSQYKKVIASVLYLDITRSTKTMAYGHIIAAWAAFIAAALNSFLTIFIFRAYATNTLFFVIAMALVYVFKDRVKNIFKLMLGAQTLSRFPDSSTTIKGMSGKKTVNLGEIREKVFFPNTSQISQTALKIKNKNTVLPEKLLEKVLLYQKEINIKTSLIKKHYNRTTNLTDIMRFNVNQFLANMGNPEKSIYAYNAQNKELLKTKGARVYNLDLVIKYTKFSKKRKRTLHYEHYNIICTRFGIKRVEFMSKV